MKRIRFIIFLLSLTVIAVREDNGQGFKDDQSMNSKGFGMRGMNERVKILQGTMTFHSAPGKGTTLQFEIPII